MDGPAETRAPRTPRDLELLSVIVPVYNEEDTLEQMNERLGAVLADVEYEVIFVDDGSTDDSMSLLAGLAADSERVRVLRLSRNFGHQAALTAGLDHARGDAIITIDCDLQDPPELIPELIQRWREGAEIVNTYRRSRAGESRIKRLTASLFYRAFDRLAQLDLSERTGDFRLLDRRALDALGSMRERNRFLRGMSAWIGYRQETVPFDRDPRFAGETKYTPRKMVRFSLDALSSFSNVPLQLATMMGFVFSAIAFMGIPIAIGFRIAGEFVPGIATVLLAVLLLGGIQLITVGIIGEYLGRVYDEVKARPLYLLDEERSSPAPVERES